MTRGDIITVALSGDYGKPRPALVVQSNALPDTDSVLVCLLTSVLREAPLYRLDGPADESTGLRVPSQVMADKPVTIRRERIGQKIGRLGNQDMARLNAALAFVLGLAD